MERTHWRKEDVASVLETVGTVTGEGAVFHALHGSGCQMNGSLCGFCAFCLDHPSTARLCRYACCGAAMQAMASGEPHFQQCWAGLLFATVPVAPRQVCEGAVSVGGFVDEGNRGEWTGQLEARLSPLPPSARAQLLSRLDTVREIAPAAFRGLGFFALEATFAAGLNAAAFFAGIHERYLQQRRIAEAVADLRLASPAPADIVHDTYQLVAHLHRRDPDRGREFISRYLARILLVCNWNLEKLRGHLRVLLAVMTCDSILAGERWASAAGRELRCLSRLEQAQSTEDACYEVAEFVRDHFLGPAPREGRGALARRTLDWLLVNHAGRAALPRAAADLGVSVSTLVHGLRRESATTFGQLLRETRLSQAKKLLATTALPLSDVADRCGYTDQSHFTRAFKAGVNLTPGQFRKLLP